MIRLLAGILIIVGCAVTDVVSIGAAQSAYRITLDEGGRVDRYVEKYTAVRLSGGSIILDGGCFSACALIAGLMPADHVCITPRAFLGFHSASEVSQSGERHYSAYATKYLWRMLSEPVRVLVRAQGWDGETEHEALVFIEGDELKTLFATCVGE
jgi:hypothetical protein